MTDNQDRILPSYSPDKLLAHFTQSRFGFYLIIAVVLHVVFITATSVGYINDRWIDPEGAAQRKADLAAALTNRPPAVTSTNLAVAGGASNIVTGVSTAAAPAAGTGVVTKIAGTNVSDIPADRTNTVVVKQITATAQPSEIPSSPDNLGISIKDTNPK